LSLNSTTWTSFWVVGWMRRNWSMVLWISRGRGERGDWPAKKD